MWIVIGFSIPSTQTMEDRLRQTMRKANAARIRAEMDFQPPGLTDLNLAGDQIDHGPAPKAHGSFFHQ